MITFILNKKRSSARDRAAAALLAGFLVCAAAHAAPAETNSLRTSNSQSVQVGKPKAPADKPASPTKDNKTTTNKPTTAEASATSSKAEPKSTAKKPAAPKPASARKKALSERLVPPPPPSIPGVLAMPKGVSGFEMIEFVSKGELCDLKERTTGELERAQKKLTLAKHQAGEKKKRAVSFETLYSEGVVSRRELEAAQHEALTTDDDLSEQEHRVDDLKAKLTRIEARLKSLAK